MACKVGVHPTQVMGDFNLQTFHLPFDHTKHNQHSGATFAGNRTHTEITKETQSDLSPMIRENGLCVSHSMLVPQVVDKVPLAHTATPVPSVETSPTDW